MFRLYLKRDDLISAEFPGNKWRKLKYNLEAARDGGHRTLLTFGGAYSNHIRATAAAGAAFGFATIGVIRGEEHRPLNPSLRYAVDRGMQLTYLDRPSYRRKTSRQVIRGLRDRFGDFYLLPGGGSNALAARGCAELPAELAAQLPSDVLCVPCATGGTLAGVAAGLDGRQRAIGFSALRGGASFLPGVVRALQAEAFGGPRGEWQVDDEFHFGGFARRTPGLDAFIAGFRQRHALTLDRIYVAKMMYGLYTHAARGTFRPGSTVVAVITG
jgi:1-aminocyclopropane-1-carboxylate deaminase